MNFKQYFENASDWENFKSTHFLDDLAGFSDDFYCWLRYDGMSPQDFDYTALERLFQKWMKSSVKGKWCEKTDSKRDRERRKEFGPGKFWAPTSSGLNLNKNFVKGWRGINPKNP